MDSISLEYAIGLAITLVCGLCGGVWWCADLSSTVKGIRRTMVAIHEDLTKLNGKLEHIDQRLNGHELRIVKLEATRK